MNGTLVIREGPMDGLHGMAVEIKTFNPSIIAVLKAAIITTAGKHGVALMPEDYSGPLLRHINQPTGGAKS